MSSATVAGAWVPSERLIGLAAEALADLFPADAARAGQVFAAPLGVAGDGEQVPLELVAASVGARAMATDGAERLPLAPADWSGLNPADQRLAVWLRRHPSLGARERRWLSDRIYDVLRHGRAYECWLRQAFDVAGGVEGDTRLHVARALIELSAANTAGGASDSGVSLSADQYRAWLSAQPSALRDSLPDWLWAGLVETHGQVTAGQLAEVLVQPAAIEIRTNLLKGKAQTLKARLAEAGVEADEVPGSNTALRLKGRPALSRSPLFEAGWFEWQDVGSQQIAELCAARRGERVVDFCAGAGGKTLALAARMRNQGQVLAFDTEEARLSKLAPRLTRAGISIVTSMRLDGCDDPRLARYQRWADLVLVDAPCSGSGTFRRHPDLKWRLKPEDVGHYQALQRQILQAAVRLVRPGGRLVYATCSLLDQENGQQMAWFGQWLAGQGGALARMAQHGSQYWLPDSAGGDAFFMSEWRLPK